LNVGDEVSVRGGQVGTIREIFENGIIEIYLEGQTGTHLARASQVKKADNMCSDLLKKFSEF
jgi:preprotein translocase subunit YajC